MNRSLRAAIFAAAIFFLLPVSAAAAETLIPVGSLIGIQLQDDTVTVAAFEESPSSAAKAAGLKIGDEILQINQIQVNCTDDVRNALQSCGSLIEMTIRRGSRTTTLCFAPDMGESGPKLGVYLRQGISGIGTVTYFDPETGCFASLGHGVNGQKGGLLAMKRGFAYEAELTSVVPGKYGEPGQLKGSADGVSIFGSILKNTHQGVFVTTPYGWEGNAIPVAEFSEVQTGSAQIRSTVCGSGPRDYSVEILKIYPPDHAQTRNFLLKVTDAELLSLTGGIVQGMSGSPIIQDGKLVGAVTHVLVNDPTRGFGIFIENMLDAAG